MGKGINGEDLGKGYYQKANGLYYAKKGVAGEEIYDSAQSGDAANEYECSREDFHAVDGTIQCPSCGRQIDKLSAFCPCCGNRLPADDSAKPDCSAKRYCAACGSELNSAAAFCPHCGAKN